MQKKCLKYLVESIHAIPKDTSVDDRQVVSVQVQGLQHRQPGERVQRQGRDGVLREDQDLEGVLETSPVVGRDVCYFITWSGGDKTCLRLCSNKKCEPI